MAREPGKIVGYVEDADSKVRTAIRLLSDRMVFYARVGEATTEDKDGDVVRKWVRAQMKAMRVVTWSPVIVVELSSVEKPEPPHYNGRELEAIVGRVDFAARRTYVARLGKAVRELDWKDHDEYPDPMARVDESHSLPWDPAVLNALPWRPRRNSWASVEIVFAYDEQTWDGLVAIIESIERSRAALKRILNHAGPAGEFLRLVGSGGVPVGALVPGPPADYVEEEVVDEDDDA